MQPAVLVLCLCLLSTAVNFLGAYSAAAAVIRIINRDGDREGLNDRRAPDPASTAGGNPGATRGGQRRIALQYAADIWGGLISSPVEIRVGAKFNPLPCDENSAVLGGAGPNTVHRNFVGAPLLDTWYTQALANSFAAMDLAEDHDDMGATFSSVLGTASCPFIWYYGLDGNAPLDTIDFVTVALHELAHGLGFLSLVDLATGARLFGSDDVFMRNLENHNTGKVYPEMTAAERVSASKSTGNLHWIGSNVLAVSGALTDGVHPTGHVEMYAPAIREEGGSVSHFSEALAPDEIMEPFYTGANHDVGITLELLVDLGWNVGGDDLAPRAVADLATTASTLTSIDLSWTAPGDNGSAGTAAAYDVRYAASKITNANWTSAIPVNGEPAPLAARSPQNLTVPGLSCGTRYYFALKTSDDTGNVSRLSNVASGKTQTCPKLTVAPLVLPHGEINIAYNEEFEITGGFPPYTIEIVKGSLPQGLSFGSPVVSGTPLEARSSSVTIRVTDQVGARTKKILQVKILKAVRIVTNSLAPGRANKSYVEILSADRGKKPYSWAVTSGALPSGLTLDSATGRIIGTPDSPGTTDVTFQVTDSLTGIASKNLTLIVE